MTLRLQLYEKCPFFSPPHTLPGRPTLGSALGERVCSPALSVGRGAAWTRRSSGCAGVMAGELCRLPRV